MGFRPIPRFLIISTNYQLISIGFFVSVDVIRFDFLFESTNAFVFCVLCVVFFFVIWFGSVLFLVHIFYLEALAFVIRSFPGK